MIGDIFDKVKINYADGFYLDLPKGERDDIDATISDHLKDRYSKWMKKLNRQNLISKSFFGFDIEDRCYLFTGKIDFIEKECFDIQLRTMEVDEALDLINYLKNSNK